MSGLLVTALLAQCLVAAEPSTVSVFQPGQEGRALDLIAPHTSANLRLEGWDLDAMVPGPACAVHFTFAREAERVGYVFEPTDGAPELRVLEATAAAPEALTRTFEALLRSNDPEAIFEDACIVRIEDSREELVLGDAPLPAADVPTGRHALLTLLLLLPLAALGFLLLRRSSTTPQAPRPAAPRASPETPRSRIGLAVLVSSAIGLRLLVARHLGPGDFELENFPRDLDLWALVHVLGSFVHPPPPQTFHAPLLDSLLQGWSVLGDALGIGGQLLWLRVPNLALAGLMVWLLVRLGEALGDRRVGWISAAVFAVSPLLIQLSVPQGHYFLEMVATTWFLERLATCVRRGRPAHRSLAVAAAVALWSGFLSAVIVGPGLLIHGLRTWRRGDRRRALGVLLLAFALTAPVVGTALTSALDMGRISTAAAQDTVTEEGLAAVYGHTSMRPAAEGITGTPRLAWNLTVSVVGLVGAPLVLLLLFLAPALDRQGWAPLLALLAYVALGAALPLRMANFTAVMPLLLVGGIRAALLAIQRFLPAPRHRPAVAALVLCLVGSSLVTGPEGTFEQVPLMVYGRAWLTQGDVQEVMAVAQAPEHAGLPLARVSPARDTAYHLCPDRETRAGVVACVDAPMEVPLPGLLRYSIGDREVQEIRIPPGAVERCPPGLAPDAPLAQLDGPHLLALDPAYVDVLAAMGCGDPREGRDCRSLGRAPEVELWICGR